MPSAIYPEGPWFTALALARTTEKKVTLVPAARPLQPMTIYAFSSMSLTDKIMRDHLENKRCKENHKQKSGCWNNNKRSK